MENNSFMAASNHADFDIDQYNPFTAGCDLTDMSIDHYLVERLRLLNIDFYKRHKHDGCSADLDGMADPELIEHFIKRAKIEKRVYNKRILDFLDPAYYRETYPSLGLATNSDAEFHWLYYGVFERKSPNSITSGIMEAHIHLFQMGKVGSKSLQKSINAFYPSKIVPHLHFAHEMLLTYPHCYYSYPEIIKLNSKGIKFLSGIRDPFSRVVSGWIEAACSINSSMTLSKVSEHIANAYSDSTRFSEELKIILEWFSHYYYCDIDVYKTEFNKEAGYSIINGGKHSIFIYRIDKLPDLWGAVSNFLGMELELIKTNLAEDKGIIARQAINDFKNLKLPRSFVENICENDFMKHFYTSKEIEEFIIKYS